MRIFSRHIPKKFARSYFEDVTEFNIRISRIQKDFLYFTRDHQFQKAQLLFQEIQELEALKREGFAPAKKEKTENLKSYVEKNDFINDELLDAFKQIGDLFGKPKKCLELLSELDNEIASFQSFLNCDFKKIKPGVGIFLPNYIWVPDFSPNYSYVNTYGLLRYLLRKKLQTHQIEKQDKLYTLSGFVVEASKIVANGALFIEQFLMGISLTHGIYTHYLQWYLIAVAFEKKLFSFDQRITLRDLLTTSVAKSQYQMDSEMVWPRLLDFVIQSTDPDKLYNFNLGAPQRSNSLLLRSPVNPHLRGYLLNSWHRNIAEFQRQFALTHPDSDPIPYICLVGAQTVFQQSFGACNVGMRAASVERFYRETLCNNVDIQSHETGAVITESAQEKFSIVDRQYQLIQSKKTKPNNFFRTAKLPTNNSNFFNELRF